MNIATLKSLHDTKRFVLKQLCMETKINYDTLYNKMYHLRELKVNESDAIEGALKKMANEILSACSNGRTQ